MQSTAWVKSMFGMSYTITLLLEKGWRRKGSEKRATVALAPLSTFEMAEVVRGLCREGVGVLTTESWNLMRPHFIHRGLRRCSHSATADVCSDQVSVSNIHSPCLIPCSRPAWRVSHAPSPASTQSALPPRLVINRQEKGFKFYSAGSGWGLDWKLIGFYYFDWLVLSVDAVPRVSHAGGGPDTWQPPAAAALTQLLPALDKC